MGRHSSSVHHQTALRARITFVFLKVMYFELVRDLYIWDQTKVGSILPKQLLSSKSFQFLLHFQELFLEFVQSLVHSGTFTGSSMKCLFSMLRNSVHHWLRHSHYGCGSWYFNGPRSVTLRDGCSWRFDTQRSVTLRHMFIGRSFSDLRSVTLRHKIERLAPRSVGWHYVSRISHRYFTDRRGDNL